MFGRQLFGAELLGGEMLGMDDFKHATIERAQQDADVVVADEGIFQCCHPPRARTGQAITLQGSTDECELALQLMHIQFLEVCLQHAPEENPCNDEQACAQRGEQDRQARGQRYRLRQRSAHAQTGSIDSST